MNVQTTPANTPSSTPQSPTTPAPQPPTQKSTVPPISALVQRAFQLLAQQDSETIVRKAAPALQDYLIQDVIHWANDDPNTLAREIMVELFKPQTKSKTSEPEFTPNPEYVNLAHALVTNSPRYLRDDPYSLCILLMRVSLSRLYFKKAQQLNVQ